MSHDPAKKIRRRAASARRDVPPGQQPVSAPHARGLRPPRRGALALHDLRAFLDPRAVEVADTFDAWLDDAVTGDPAERDERLPRWPAAPMARRAHPREEPLLPLMVIAGAAGHDRGRKVYSGPFVQARVSAFAFG